MINEKNATETKKEKEKTRRDSSTPQNSISFLRNQYSNQKRWSKTWISRNPPITTNSSLKIQNKKNPGNKKTYLANPSSRIACSSPVQSFDIPGLCFKDEPEEGSWPKLPLFGLLPLNEEGPWLPSWLCVPDGFAIEKQSLSKIYSLTISTK